MGERREEGGVADTTWWERKIAVRLDSRSRFAA